MPRVDPPDRVQCNAPIGTALACNLPAGHAPYGGPAPWALKHVHTFSKEPPVTVPIEDMDPAAFTTVALDFDGVFHPYSKGWHDGTCYDPPTPEGLAAVEQLMGTRPVAIVTARPLDPIGDWLDRHAAHIPYVLDQNMYFGHWADPTTLLVTNRKIVAAHYVDDRALRFRADASEPANAWDEILTSIAEWDAWYARRRAASGVTG